MGTPPGVDWQTKWNYYLPVVLRTRAVKIESEIKFISKQDSPPAWQQEACPPPQRWVLLCAVGVEGDAPGSCPGVPLPQRPIQGVPFPLHHLPWKVPGTRDQVVPPPSPGGQINKVKTSSYHRLRTRAIIKGKLPLKFYLHCIIRTQAKIAVTERIE